MNYKTIPSKNHIYSRPHLVYKDGMQTYTALTGLPQDAQDCVIVIGNFDGVHRGHRALINDAATIARATGKKLGVLCFEPHPRSVFRPDDPPFRLTDHLLRAERLSECGIDHLFVLTFDWDFASQTADQFIDRVLRSGLNAAHIVVGNDFAFGQMRRGTADTLRQSGLPVTIIDKIADEGDGPLSSSAIRQALRLGDIAHANAMLGWDWEMRGMVQHGDKRGRTIGYPTANVALGDVLHPAYGIYAAWVKIGDDPQWHPSATNIGIRPMFAVPVGQIESYIFDFDRDIYGQTLRVRPVKRLRGEAKFESLDALIGQIAQDCIAAAAILKAAG